MSGVENCSNSPMQILILTSRKSDGFSQHDHTCLPNPRPQGFTPTVQYSLLQIFVVYSHVIITVTCREIVIEINYHIYLLLLAFECLFSYDFFEGFFYFFTSLWRNSTTRWLYVLKNGKNLSVILVCTQMAFYIFGISLCYFN